MKYLLFFLLTVPVYSQNFDPAEIAAHRESINRIFADPKTSPLREEDRKSFTALHYFEPDQRYYITAQFRITPDTTPFEMKTTTERMPRYRKYGELHFELEGQKMKLNVYQNQELMNRKVYEDYLFLPFSDLTNEAETYVGGRYLDFRIPTGDTVVLDFNLAYNPYCAYNYDYSCPLVPLENDLPVAIRAGVKKFHD